MVGCKSGCQLRVNDAEGVVGASSATVQQHQPCTLQVLNRRNSLQQLVVCLSEMPTGSERNHGGQEECPKCGHLGQQSEVRRRPHHGLRIVDSGDGLHHVNASWHHAFPVPNLRFSVVDTDVGMVEQRILQNPIDGAHSVGRTHDVHIVQERKQTLICLELGLQSLKCGVLPKGKQGGHQWVTLFTTFCLYDCVDDAVVVLPQITRS